MGGIGGRRGGQDQEEGESGGIGRRRGERVGGKEGRRGWEV